MVVLIQSIVTSVQYYVLTLQLAIQEIAAKRSRPFAPLPITWNHAQTAPGVCGAPCEVPRSRLVWGLPDQIALPVTQLIGSRLTQLELRGFR